MIYTNIEGLKIKVKTKSYTRLGDKFVDWIENTTIKLYKGRNKYEDKASFILKELGLKFEPQCLFFDSSTKQTYFLDFLLIDKNIAIEIDGDSHKSKEQSDKVRDRFFQSIGIKTIRIKNEKVTKLNIKNAIFPPFIINVKKKNKDLLEIKNMINKYNKKYRENLTIK